MSKSLNAAELEAQVVRYLLVQGQPCDYASIRHGAELTQVARSDLWAAIRSLIDSRLVSYAYRSDVTTYEGFQQSMSYPVFWVDRESVVRDGPMPAESPGAPGSLSPWWRAYIGRLGGKAVRP